MIAVRCVELAGDFSDPVVVWHRFLVAVGRLPGLTVLGSIKHEFPGGGLTGLVAIGESHVAIHTWPEHGYAWVELATCGDPATLDVFESGMKTTFA
jgi:S-adenosylmethionine decarboxylase